MSFVAILWVLFAPRPLLVGFCCARVSSMKRREEDTTGPRDLNRQNVELKINEENFLWPCK